jgi:hypothetical protein
MNGFCVVVKSTTDCVPQRLCETLEEALRAAGSTWRALFEADAATLRARGVERRQLVAIGIWRFEDGRLVHCTNVRRFGRTGRDA